MREQLAKLQSSVEIQTETNSPTAIENALPKQPVVPLQPSSAHLDASYSPARPASWTPSEDEDSDSSVRRLLRQEACGDLASDLDDNIDSDFDSVPGAEDGLERAPPGGAPRRRRRPRVTEYKSRRRNHGELRELVEGVDYDLTDLHEPDLRVTARRCAFELIFSARNAVEIAVNTVIKITVEIAVGLLAQQAIENELPIYVIIAATFARDSGFGGFPSHTSSTPSSD